MNNAGKTLTIFLIVISILLLSLTVITIFFFKKENEIRKTTESKLSESEAKKEKFAIDLKESQKKVFLLEEQNKEADERINNLLDDVELEKGLRKELSLKNTALQQALEDERGEKKKMQNELVETQGKLENIDEQLDSSEAMRQELTQKLKQIEEEVQPLQQQEEVELQKIVIAPGDIKPGVVLRVDTKNNFVIFDLGSQDGIRENMFLSISRGKKYLGDIKASRTESNLSVGDFIPPLTARKVKKNDTVMVKE